MCCCMTIFLVAPLFGIVEVHPLVGKFVLDFVFCQGKIANEISKALIKPKIIPPVHCHKITEPHMSQLMCNSYCSSVSSFLVYFLFKNQSFVKSHASWMFHGSPVEFRDVDTVIFAKWIGLTKEFLIKLNAFV